MRTKPNTFEMTAEASADLDALAWALDEPKFRIVNAAIRAYEKTLEPVKRERFIRARAVKL